MFGSRLGGLVRFDLTRNSPKRGSEAGEVAALHEPALLRVTDPRSGPRLCEAQRFVVPRHARKRKEALHEPCLLSPSLSSTQSGGEGARRAGEAAPRFMVPMRVKKNVEALDQPRGRRRQAARLSARAERIERRLRSPATIR